MPSKLRKKSSWSKVYDTPPMVVEKHPPSFVEYLVLVRNKMIEEMLKASTYGINLLHKIAIAGIAHASVITILTFRLVKALIKGTWAWFLMFSRLSMFVAALLPAFLTMLCHWLFHPLVLKNVAYGERSRNSLDLYLVSKKDLTEKASPKRPVLIFLTGGAWIIGYKMWGCLMGRALQKQGIVFVAPDYRNFPQAQVGEMVDDVTSAIDWTLKNIDRYGGDPEKVYLAGQSAGAHLAALALLLRAASVESAALESRTPVHHLMATLNPRALPRAALALPSRVLAFPQAGYKQVRTLFGGGEEENLDNESSSHGPEWEVGEVKLPKMARGGGVASATWDPCKIKAFIGISGPYCLTKKMENHMHKRGLDRKILTKIMGEQVEQWSPHTVAKALGALGGLHRLPPVLLCHGRADRTVPWWNTESFANILRKGGASDVITKYYEKWSHTDPILEAPMAGEDVLCDDILKEIHRRSNIRILYLSKAVQQNPVVLTKRMLPDFLIKAGRYVNPF
eukprot:CAMPEP_0117763054 /NCGR_PEP_ID=MMETSP0947-20121206/18369_1 /TAXON_ID=44440 /ORGANISM="Chattonella subsalsa, Strain CCMP2191" /LENGTH=508 /DNA_ID=CAMNT_0005584607 /DNA_START=204 /DNA_END=1730 /DNA_ORIENTATION=-